MRPCPRCRKLLPDHARFCRRCGDALPPAQIPPAAARTTGHPLLACLAFAAAMNICGMLIHAMRDNLGSPPWRQPGVHDVREMRFFGISHPFDRARPPCGHMHDPQRRCPYDPNRSAPAGNGDAPADDAAQ
jgi:hypothetical protein